MKKENKILFANQAQKILFLTELIYQMKSGYWRVAKPHDHFKVMKTVKVDVDTENPRIEGFVPAIAYNFANTWILKNVAKKLIAYVKFFSVLPDYPHDMRKDALKMSPELFEMGIDNLKGIVDNVEEINKNLKEQGINEINANKINALYLMRKRFEENGLTQAKAKQIMMYDYTMTDLKADLRDMSTLFRETCHKADNNQNVA